MGSAKIVAGNWKMNGSLENNQSLLNAVKAKIGKTDKVIIIPPFVYLNQVSKLLEGTNICLGAQNLCDQSTGAYTGEISGSMLKEAGCDYVLVGHSERRTLYGETNEIVTRKFAQAKQSGLIPILCVGETLAERENNQTQAIVAEQLETVIRSVGIEALENTIIAYEPVWAIGTGKTATPEQAEEMHEFIYYTVSRKSDTISRSLNVLYGGSVKASTAKDLFRQKHINGALVGGASLDSNEFAQIILSGIDR